ncbi:protein SOB FIVE-LIKE 5-like [Primulina tabacum]|uniref:protein SOB FIVE-LIKE 5-like n=1 Tax=Primulina tabacum TaxID=48773 RepID=UPI003F5A1C1E
MDYICPFEDNQEISSSSGCESGWTLYLGHSSASPQALSNQEHDFFGAGRNRVYHEVEEDEDLSMVSDASSGPPHLNEEDSYGSTGKDNNGGCFYPYENINESALSGKNLKRQKTEENRRRIKDINKDQSSSNLLDDTASSPFFGFSTERLTHTRSRQASMENELEYSQGYSTTHFEGRAPNYHETFDFFQSPVSGNQLYQDQWFEGKRW